MKTFKRADRISKLLLRALSESLIQAVRDPRVSTAVVTDVKVTADVSIARVYVRSLDKDCDTQKMLEGFQACSGLLRGELGRRVHLFRIPRLEFFYDELPDKAAAVEALLDELRRGD
ncbi:MAG: 30S ribosome-binding factor RbfA [Deltaproteobacteria bacterium]|nr:30S ribosome-binding factor RbfA [Deltaproteobacteria bacterium]